MYALPPRLRSAAALLAPVVLLVALAWSRRWMSDDGFINLRIVEQIKANRGPVFNPGERVEAGTSLLWLVLLVIIDLLLPLRLEWVAVLSGLLCGATALYLAGRAARELWSSESPGARLLPVGMVCFAALPPVWDFITSGLETPLVFLWLAVAWSTVAHAYRRRDHKTVAPALLLGCAPLVRPDLAIVAAPLVLAWLLLGYRSPKQTAGRAILVSLPVLVTTVLRAGFFAVLVPNTALAKEAGSANWEAGLTYLADTVITYWVWLPLLIAALLSILLPMRERGGTLPARLLTVLVAPVLGGALHLLWLVRVGGDFMHGRMVLPAIFSMLLPAMQAPIRSRVAASLAGVSALWVLASLILLRPAPGPFTFSRFISNERAFYVGASGAAHPVTLDDYLKPGETPDKRRVAKVWVDLGRRAKARRDAGAASMLWYDREAVLHDFRPQSGALWPNSVVLGNIGIVAFAAGPDVYVADPLGLADPYVSRTRLKDRGRAGHEKLMDAVVLSERISPKTLEAELDANGEMTRAAMRQVQQCGWVADLNAATRDPLTWRRFVRNVALAPTLTFARVDKDPIQAYAELCASTADAP